MAQRPSGRGWQFGTVERFVDETFRVKTFTLRLPEWRPFLAGQHVDVRLTAPDGYQAQRSYSIATAPEMEGAIDLTIESMPEGEVSSYFHGVVEVGDAVEVRGPIGGPFTWTVAAGGPLLLVGGGSGIVPLMSMLRHRQTAAPQVLAVMLYSSRTYEEIIYREELDLGGANLMVLHTLTRSTPPNWTGYARRIDRQMVAEAIERLGNVGRAFICGSESFTENVANTLVEVGVEPERIRTERFGPSGP